MPLSSGASARATCSASGEPGRPARSSTGPASLRGAEAVVIEPDERRRALACGYAAPPAPVDVAIVAVGAPEAYREAFDALAPRGRLVVFSGLLPDADSALHVGLNRVHYLEHTVVGAYGCCFRHGEAALDLLAGGDLRVDDLISHRLPLRDLERGLDIVARRTGMKVHLYPDPALIPERSPL